MRKVAAFLRRSYLMVGLFGWPEEKNALINNPLARATTPDQLIEAVVIQSIAKEFEKWSLQDHTWPMKAVPSRSAGYARALNEQKVPRINFINRSKSIQCVIELDWRYQYNDDDERWEYLPNMESFTVNGAKLSGQAGERIMKSYVKIREQLRKAEEEAAAALKRQQDNDKKWNVAEELLGLRRNEHGALVPIDTLEGCGSGPCVGNQPDKMCYCGNCKGKNRAKQTRK